MIFKTPTTYYMTSGSVERMTMRGKKIREIKNAAVEYTVKECGATFYRSGALGLIHE